MYIIINYNYVYHIHNYNCTFIMHKTKAAHLYFPCHHFILSALIESTLFFSMLRSSILNFGEVCK